MPILDDTLDEPIETFTVTLSDADGATIADDEATATITDNDMPALSIDDLTVAEDAGSAHFTVTLDQAGTEVVTVDYATADGTADAGSDYTATAGTLTIAAGSVAATITVPILDDTLVEPNEAFTVALSDARGATIADGEATATIITDNDVPALSIDDLTVAEDAGSASIAVTLDQAGTETVTVDYATADRTADEGSDYTATAGTLTIAAGSVAATITVPILDDTLVEPIEAFTVTLSDADGATIADGEATATITDNDVPALSIDDLTVAEDAGSARFAVTLDQAGTEAVTVDYATADGTADEGSDYTATAGTLTIAAGSVAATITVPILDDTLAEPKEAFTVALSDAGGATIADGEATATITDNDVLALSIDDVTVAEDAGSARFTVTLDQAGTETVSVDYATADGTAAAASDYTRTAGTLTIAAGSVAATITVPILDDTLVEPIETFTVTLSDAGGATIADGEATATITDNDVPALSIDDLTVAEDAGSAHFTVTLDQAGTETVSVDYATADGTADAGSDYTVTAGTLTIAAGSVAATITVPILDDTLAEPVETFTVALSHADGATIADGEATATITDNDAPALSIDDLTVAEDAGSAHFVVTLDQAGHRDGERRLRHRRRHRRRGFGLHRDRGHADHCRGLLERHDHRSGTRQRCPRAGRDVYRDFEQRGGRRNLGQRRHGDHRRRRPANGGCSGPCERSLGDPCHRLGQRPLGIPDRRRQPRRRRGGPGPGIRRPLACLSRTSGGNCGGPAHDHRRVANVEPRLRRRGRHRAARRYGLLAPRAHPRPSNSRSRWRSMARRARSRTRAVAQYDDGNGNAGEDLSDNGRNPDPDGDGDPSGEGEDDPTPVEFPAALIGTVFADLDVDGVQDANETGLAGWRVEVSTSESEAVAVSGATGSYAFASVDAGEAVVRFRHPESNAVWRQEAMSFSSSNLTRLDYAAVPGGTVYDSVSRTVLSGVLLALADSSGTHLPTACLLDGQQPQRTGSDGAYRFDIVHGANGACTTAATTYRIEVAQAHEDYVPPPSALIPPADMPLRVATCAGDAGAPCVVFPDARPPSAPTLADYYLEWVLAGGDGAVVHNHVPLDPLSSVLREGLVSVSKRATVRTASVGDLVGYTVQVASSALFPLMDVNLIDNPPAGFAFVPDSASLQGPGPDGTLGTGDDLSGRLAASGTDPITFNSIELPAGKAVSIRYMTRVTTGASPGQHVNTVNPFVRGTLVGNEATASVEVTSDPVFEKTTVIGKVFDDRDGDGSQDPGEQGIPGVRLVTVGGLIVETDAHGRYHLADVAVADAANGDNFIVKLDPRTLARGAVVTGENPRVIRLTQSLMSKVNFPVKLPAPGQEVGGIITSKLLREVHSHHLERIEPVRFASGESDVQPGYLDRLRTLLARYRGKQNLRVRFSGHTDDQPLSWSAQAIYADNQGLSEARAREVAKFVADELGLPNHMIETAGHAERLPVASNRTPAGMALNRRVETELVYDEYTQEEQPVDAPPSAPEPTERIRYVEERARLEPALFASGAYRLSDGQTATIDGELEPFGDYDILGATVVGHADSEQPSQASRPSNERLSRLRAESVATYLAEKLDLAAPDAQVEAKGAADPVADNRTVAGRALNRRADIELRYRRIAQTVTTRVITVATVQMAPTAQVGPGRIWLTEDLLANRPQLDALALNDVAVDEHGKMQRPVIFAGYTNYAAWIGTYTLRVYKATDTDLVRPLATLTTKTLDHDKAFEFFDPALTLKPGEGLAYVLEATAESGQADVTHARLVGVVNARRPPQLREPETIWGQSNLARQSINVRGSRVRVHGEGFAAGERLRVHAQETPVDGNGRFVAELHLPRGAHQIVVSGVAEGRTWSETLTADVDENYAFIVGLANLTVGQTTVSGRFEPLAADDSFDETVHVDGRLAFYLKAKVQAKYLVTAQLDTTQDELGNLSDNLKRKDPRRVFRQLDPDKYYPVYGDDSTTVSDVDSQGPLYLRVDWDRSTVLFGNFETRLTDTEYMQYSRSLYGAKFAHRSEGDTRFGDAKRSLTAFASEAQSAAAHVTFRGTGGSLYYLKHTDIVEGSQKVTVEIRQRDTGQVLERQDFMAGRDYEIDALQGRIILSSPLSRLVSTYLPAIIRTRPLDGDDVFLLVDYEYLPEALEADEMTYGVRAKTWLGDHVAVGASKIVDQQQGRDYDLEGIDVTLKAGKGTYLSVEAARSHSLKSGAGFDSVDGGLSFLAHGDGESGPSASGEALAVEGRVNLAEISDTVTGDLRAWWKERDAAFSAGRLGHRFDTVEKGVATVVQAGENVSLQAGYSERDQGALASSRVGRVQADARTGKFSVGGELRHEDIRRNGLYGIEIPDGAALLAGVRVGYDVDAARTVYGSVQTGLDESGAYVDNDLVALGLDTQISETTSVIVEASEGDRGSALSGGFEYAPTGRAGFKIKSGIGSGALTQFSGNYKLPDGHELYGSYALDPDRTYGERNLLTLGQRRDMGNRFGIFTESQLGDDDRYAGASHTFGLDYKTTHDWIFSGLITIADNQLFPTSLERQALSFGASTQTPVAKFSSKLEYRNDEGPATKVDQYLATTSYTHRVDENRRWLGRLNVSATEDRLVGLHDARFVEFDIGHAFRPVADDRWNTLLKYGYFQDLVSIGQDSARPDQRVHIVSAEAVYQVSEHWNIGGKVALKEGRMRSFRNTGTWHDASLALAVVRARRHVVRQWDAVAEYRLLHDRQGKDRRHGALLGIYRHLGENLEIGSGYNFTEFSNDIRDARYNQKGWFIDLIGKL